MVVCNMLNNYYPKDSGAAGLVVLDVGCGYGDLCDYLEPQFTYYGVEAIDWVREVAVQRTPFVPTNRFIAGDITDPDLNLPEVNIVIALGVLATVSPENLQSFANRLLGIANHAVLVSFLRASDYKDDEGFFSYTKEQITDAFGEGQIADQPNGITSFLLSIKK